MSRRWGRWLSRCSYPISNHSSARAQSPRPTWHQARATAGTWGYTKTGTIYLPTGAALFASIGTLTFDAAGNVTGTLEASLGGTIGNGEVAGTFTMNSNCSGTMAFGVYDQSGNLLRTVTMALVLDDKARELRGLMTSLVLPNGMSLPTVITGNARRLFPNQGNQQ